MSETVLILLIFSQTNLCCYLGLSMVVLFGKEILKA